MVGIIQSARRLMAMATIIGGSGLSFVALASESAAELAEAESFVLDTSKQAISILDASDTGDARLKQLFRSRFDHELMGRYAMGGYWKQADPAQQAEYRSLFADYVPNHSVAKLKDFRGASIAVVGSRSVEDGDSMVMTSVAPANGEKVVFGWRIRTDQQDYKIIDIVFGGASYLTTLRQQFTSIAARNGVEGLLDLLRKQTASKGSESSTEFDTLADKMRSTAAIDTMSKLTLKRRTDALVTQISRYHAGEGEYEIASLKSRFDALIQHGIALLRSGDPSLAAEIDDRRTALWSSLSDPEQFAVVAMR